ncbi:hypothetical protein BaRGS_00025783 [Batillaria attramentaria]|uniref:Uncharacterized protein n=1 Tax=Batillaria attramentaria TaxID=370345 RepID=A0ABD0K6N4_9CAEN
MHTADSKPKGVNSCRTSVRMNNTSPLQTQQQETGEVIHDCISDYPPMHVLPTGLPYGDVGNVTRNSQDAPRVHNAAQPRGAGGHQLMSLTGYSYDVAAYQLEISYSANSTFNMDSV